MRQNLLTAQPAIIPPRQDSSLLHWLERTGHLIFPEAGENHYNKEEEEELAAMIETTNTQSLESGLD